MKIAHPFSKGARKSRTLETKSRTFGKITHPKMKLRTRVDRQKSTKVREVRDFLQNVDQSIDFQFSSYRQTQTDMIIRIFIYFALCWKNRALRALRALESNL